MSMIRAVESKRIVCQEGRGWGFKCSQNPGIARRGVGWGQANFGIARVLGPFEPHPLPVQYTAYQCIEVYFRALHCLRPV